jgi:L-methionine (R)-S-oxide reductase
MSHGEAFHCEKGRVPQGGDKAVLYQNTDAQLTALLGGESNPVVIMSSIVAVLHHTMPHFFWTGFYRVVGDELLVGPYQGSPACLRIPHGKGVCGSAWAQADSIVVDDVHAFPGHIACDARSVSEIVIPWKNHHGVIVAVLDVDSSLPAAFDACDQEFLQMLMEKFPFG